MERKGPLLYKRTTYGEDSQVRGMRRRRGRRGTALGWGTAYGERGTWGGGQPRGREERGGGWEQLGGGVEGLTT